MALEKLANACGIPSHHVLHYRHENAQSIVAEHRSPGDLVDVGILGHRDGQPAEAIDVHHHMDVGTTVTHVGDAVMTDGQRGAQFLQDGDFAVSGGNAHDRLNLAGILGVAELRADDVVGGHDAFQCRLDHLLRRGRDHIKVEAVTVQIAQQLHQKRDVAFERNTAADFAPVSYTHLDVYKRQSHDREGVVAAR